MRAAILAVLVACARAPAPGRAPDAPTAEPDTVRFVAIGDAGRDTPALRSNADAIARVCVARGCDFGVVLGDNLYDRGMESADDPRMDAIVAPLAATGLRWYLVHGNHDYADGRDAQRARWARDWAARTPGFEHPAPWYAFSAGSAVFLGIDTTWAFWHGARPQRAWLEAGLADPDPRWRVVFGHHPLYSDGHHGNAGAYEGWVNVPWASGRAVRDLLEGPICNHADLYLAGHDHDLQLIEACGATHVVSGGGATARPVEDRGNRPRFAAGRTGFAWIALGEAMTVAFFDENGQLLHETGAIAPRPVL